MKIASFLALSALVGCDEGAVDDGYPWDLPPGFPPPDLPDGVTMSDEKAELGRYAFYDARLSENQTQSCGSCHQQALAFTDGLPHAVGSTGVHHRRASMGLTNAAYFSGLTWASNVVRTLEDQAMLPIFGERPVELGMAGKEDALVARFAEDAEYVARFQAAFPDEAEPVTLANLVGSIAAFERVLISGNSAYDRYIQGDASAMTESQQRGLDLFNSERLECFHCHQGFAFTDAVRTEYTVIDELPFHNTGLYNVDGQGAYPESDRGLFELTQVPEDMGRFRAPTLRNIAVTAPYMHDGSVATLDDVLDHYAAGGRTIAEGDNAGVGSDNPYKSEFMVGFTLTDQERADVLAFLDALTDESFLTDPRFADPFAD